MVLQQAQVDALRPAQAKDLYAAFEALPKQKAVPEKRLRCDQPEEDAEEEAESEGKGTKTDGDADDEEEQSPGMDPYDLADPVEILTKIPSTWFALVVRTIISLKDFIFEGYSLLIIIEFYKMEREERTDGFAS